MSALNVSSMEVTSTGVVSGSDMSIPDLTPGENRHLAMLERKIERGLQTFREVGNALLEIRDKRLYRMTHSTFESYCSTRWGIERARAYQLMSAAEVANALDSGSGEGPVNEAQARELVPAFHTDPKLAQRVWRSVRETGEPITAPTIRRVVAEMTGSPVTATQSSTELLVSRIDGLYGALLAWRKEKHAAQERRRVVSALDNLCALVADQT